MEPRGKYSPIVDDYRTDDVFGNGLTPVDTPALVTEKDYKDAERRSHRTLSVNTVTQTGNGTIVKLPTLHIPGETGELAGLSSELSSSDSADSNQSVDIAPEKLKRIYAQVSTSSPVVLVVVVHHYSDGSILTE